MRIAYRILDWCQKHTVDVFLTQMWANVKWNTFPEFQSTPTGIVHSGPLSMDDFAEGFSTCVEHLVKKRGYTCIKFLCITNEPTYRWSWWNKPPNEPMPLRPGLEAVRKALDAKGIAVPLLAPDTVGVPAFNPASMDFHELIGGYDFHWYDARFDWKPGHTISIEPADVFSVSADETTFTDRLPPSSLTIYTTYKLAHSEPGIITD